MRTLIIASMAASALFSPAALAQKWSQGEASIPDFSGFWGNPYIYGIEPPLSGPGPVVNKSRRRQVFDADGSILPPGNGVLVSNPSQLVGDYSNPILKPQAAEVVRTHGEMELSGVGAPTPINQCWPEGVPFVFTNFGMQMLQQPDKITILYDGQDHEVRQIRLTHIIHQG